ncbi:aminotransferase class I/II-fold pyridoxal phosphate-dependent enzyme [Bacillus pacificus]
MDAARKAMLRRTYGYRTNRWITSVKTRNCEKFTRDQGIAYDPSEIIVCNGAKHALYTLFQVLLDEGDEVIIPTPYWVSYPER